MQRHLSRKNKEFRFYRELKFYSHEGFFCVTEFIFIYVCIFKVQLVNPSVCYILSLAPFQRVSQEAVKYANLKYIWTAV